MKLKLFLLMLLIAFGFLLPNLFGMADVAWGDTENEITDLKNKIEQRKDKIKQLEQSIEGYKKSIMQKQLEAVSLKNQLSILGDYIERIKADITLTEEKMAKTQLEIDALKLKIQEKEDIIAKQKNIVAKMVMDINKEQKKNYLEILLSSDSFSDFYGQLQYLESIYEDLGKTVKNLRLSKEELSKKKQEQEQLKSSYERYKDELNYKKQDLTAQSGFKQDLLNQTYYSEQKFKVLLASLKEQYQTIENEISAYEREVQKKLVEQQKLKQISGDIDLSWPVNNRYITSYFYDPDYPYRHVFEHSGIDIAVSQGTPVRAAGAGYVARARRCAVSSCYSYVLIVHTGSLSSLYGHLSQVSVQADQFMNKGDVIGYSGGTPGTVGAGPFVTGPHLHFEVRASGIPTDPLKYLK